MASTPLPPILSGSSPVANGFALQRDPLAFFQRLTREGGPLARFDLVDRPIAARCRLLAANYLLAAPRSLVRRRTTMNDPQIDDRFYGFPPKLVKIIQEYGETRSAALVPGIVHGIIDRNIPVGSRANAESLSALGLTLSDDELRALANLDEATAILEKKVAQLSAPNESQ